MEKVRLKLAKIAGNFTVSKHFTKLLHNIHTMNINCPVTFQKIGRKYLDLF